MHFISLRAFTSVAGNPNLIAMAICVFDRGAVDHAIEASPQRRAHAHGAGLAGGVERVSGQRNRLSRLVALRMARTSAWELGSNSCLTALRACNSKLPEFVWTIAAPKGRGL
jgi:hypothetical protein